MLFLSVCAIGKKYLARAYSMDVFQASNSLEEVASKSASYAIGAEGTAACDGAEADPLGKASDLGAVLGMAFGKASDSSEDACADAADEDAPAPCSSPKHQKYPLKRGHK